MCYGDLDPKLVTRELDTRLSGVRAQNVERNSEPAPVLTGWATALLSPFRKKEATHG